MFRVFSVCTLALYSIGAYAELAPYYESARVLTAILDNETVHSRLDTTDQIDSVRRITNGYRIVIGRCWVNAYIRYIENPDGVIGPRNFRISVSPKYCTR